MFIQCSNMNIHCDSDPQKYSNPHYLYKLDVTSGHY